ncbi:hypothetical protein Sfum_2276 [Syntrophobacter fumaroxidans MPOB]|uniref:Uncharacterized protein n=2 Tax=Syntrophobacter TaxID=29526 RepID=A0LKK6_SYNFM|nr:hypothetical protein Sfum_2276 [Syntrophobacter fumaroxidans MPOB]
MHADIASDIHLYGYDARRSAIRSTPRMMQAGALSSGYEQLEGKAIPMSIKMPVKFHGSYRVAVRHGGFERKEICQKLSLIALSGKPKAASESDPGDGPAPSYQITYYTFGCKRMVEGKLKENAEDRLVFDADGKEYEFTPSETAC